MGQKLLTFLASTTLAYGAWRCVPSSDVPAAQDAAPPSWLLVNVPPVTDEGTQVRLVLAALEGEPTEQALALARESLKRLEDVLGRLAAEAAQTTGGARAEAEIKRLELQRLRDMAMARFGWGSPEMHSTLAETATQVSFRAWSSR